MNSTSTRNVEPLSAAMAATLRAERAARGVTIAQLVEKAGMSKSTVLRLLNGDREVNTRYLSRLAAAMDMQPETLMRRAAERLREERASEDHQI